MVKNKGFKLLFYLTLVLIIIDFITAYMNGDMLKYLEVNLLYLYTGSLIPVILLNCFMLIFIYWWYHRTRFITIRYWLLCFFVFLGFARIFAIRSNILAYLNPPPLHLAQTLTVAHKVSVSVSHSSSLFFVPLVLSLIPYFFFILDHKVIKRE